MDALENGTQSFPAVAGKARKWPEVLQLAFQICQHVSQSV